MRTVGVSDRNELQIGMHEEERQVEIRTMSRRVTAALRTPSGSPWTLLAMMERRNLVSFRLALRATTGRTGFGAAGSILMGRVRLLMYSLALCWYLILPGMMSEVINKWRYYSATGGGEVVVC